MLLHEVYFDGMAGPSEGGGGQPEGALARRSRATSDRSPSGAPSSSPWARRWAAARAGAADALPLTRNKGDGTLSNVWAADHTHSLAGGTPIWRSTCTSTPITSISAPTRRLCRCRHGEPPLAAHRPALRGDTAPATPHLIDAPAAKAMLDANPGLVVIDARLADDATHVPSACAAPAARCPKRSTRSPPQSRRAPRPGLLRLGFEIGGDCAQKFRDRGIDAIAVAGGIGAWRADGLPPNRTTKEKIMKWVTRERPKIDRIACPWLIQRFIEKQPEFLYVPPTRCCPPPRKPAPSPTTSRCEVQPCRRKVQLRCLHRRVQLSAPGLDKLADIVRGADTSRLDLTPQSAGLFAISLGLSHVYADDHEMLKHGMVLYDALYAWCRSLTGETHNWPPKMS